LVLVVAACAFTHNASADDEAEGFHFGSYGRIRAATDARGGGPQNGNFVGHGSRLDEDPYLELELRNTQYPEKDLRVRVVSTLAIAGDPFHYTGQWNAQTAIRNMFVDVKGVGHKGLTLWVGSRMYRGDDIYLLDFWPLDNLNTVGGGAIFDASSQTRVQAHVGMNRMLDGAFQYQERQLPSTTGVGSVTTATLNRPRTIASAKITEFFPSNTAPKGFKLSLHGEAHFLPSGYIETSTTQVEPRVNLPSDNGFVIGGQATAYGFGDRDGFVHLFARYAKGIAAYGDLSVPFGMDSDKKTSKASEFMIAAASNYQIDRFGVMTGAYLRRFRDASDATFNRNFFWEGILAVRPQVYTSEHTGVATEISYQYKNVNALDDDGKHRIPQAFRFSVMPFITPYGWGSYRRPILYALYTATMRNDAAQRLYPTDDVRSQRPTEHYLGIGAEWWFNSSSYP
jgi:maltoporin